MDAGEPVRAGAELSLFEPQRPVEARRTGDDVVGDVPVVDALSERLDGERIARFALAKRRLGPPRIRRVAAGHEQAAVRDRVVPDEERPAVRQLALEPEKLGPGDPAQARRDLFLDVSRPVIAARRGVPEQRFQRRPGPAKIVGKPAERAKRFVAREERQVPVEDAESVVEQVESRFQNGVRVPRRRIDPGSFNSRLARHARPRRRPEMHRRGMLSRAPSGFHPARCPAQFQSSSFAISIRHGRPDARVPKTQTATLPAPARGLAPRCPSP